MSQPDIQFSSSDGESKPSASQDRRAILVLGMHRSGTSAVTAVLGMLGADLPQDLMPGALGINDLGYFESMDLYNAHEELLAACESCWDDPMSLERSRFRQNIVERFRTKALQVLERDFSQSQLFVLKDPRMCRLVPLWIELLEEVGAAPLAVLPLRNPLEVAASLQKRDGMPPATAYLLWLRHVLEAERSTRNIPRSVMAYSDLLVDWRATTKKIASDLHLTWPDCSEEQQAAIDHFLSSSLRHHSLEEKTLYESAEVSEWIKRAYRILMNLASGSDNAANRGELDDLSSLLSDADQLLGVVLADQTRRLKPFLAKAESDGESNMGEGRGNADLNEALTASREGESSPKK